MMALWRQLLVSTVLLHIAFSIDAPVLSLSPHQDPNPAWHTTFTLKCVVNDWPGNPIYFWKRDGATLYPYADPKITFSSNKDSIIFSDVTKAQSGTYFCVAAEFMEYLFESSELLELSVQEPPFVPSNVTAGQKTSTSVQLQWNHEGAIPADHYMVSQRPGDSIFKISDTTLLVNDLSPFSIYTFSVEAYNTVGSRGRSHGLQIRTDTSSPVGVLEFSVGVRTADSLQVTWVEPPVSSANDLVTGYKLLVHVTGENELLYSLNFTSNVSSTVLRGLAPSTQHTLSMCFLTRCCSSDYASKPTETMPEGTSVAPTILPRTEGSTARKLSSGSLIGICVGVGVLLLVLVAILLVYRRKSRDPLTNTADKRTWNDGTQDAASDLIPTTVPVSPPPEYSTVPHPVRPSAAAATCATPEYAAAAAPRVTQPSETSTAQDASLSRSFCFTTSPPPAYHSRQSSNDNNSTISSLSNVGHVTGDLGDVDLDREEKEEKEVNVPTMSSSNGYTGNRHGPPRDTWI